MTIRNHKYRILPGILLSFMGFILVSLPSTATEISDGTLRRIHVPILMYHYVGQLPAEPDEYRINLTLDPSIFRQHIQYLSDAGYTAISLYELDLALTNGHPLPPKPVILTFDDGHADHYQNVFPVLKQYNFSGTFFIITSFVDNQLPQYLSWSQVQEMANAGMSMQPHTKTHIDLSNATYDTQIYQVIGSIESLHHYTNQSINAFAYPAGRYNDETLHILSNSAIRRAVTTQTGSLHTTNNRYELKRLRITNETTVQALQYLLTLRQ